MGRKSKAIAVPCNEPEFDELMEIHFKKLMRETKNKRHKLCVKFVLEKAQSKLGAYQEAFKS